MAHPLEGPAVSDPFWLEAHAELVEVHREKSGGYGTGEDPLANFTGVAAITGEPAWLYPCRRAVEKLTRIESLAAQGRVGELGEEFTDVASLMLCAEALRRRGASGGVVVDASAADPEMAAAWIAKFYKKQRG
jgi:hypothetical protein